MKIDIIICYKKRYKRGHEIDFVPPITGIYLAALTPPKHEVRVFHQQVDKLDYETNAEIIALSFFSGFASEAFRLATTFREKNKTVIAGGPHITFNIEESLKYFDSIITGEADKIWGEILIDIEEHKLKKVYTGNICNMNFLPVPRYDLLSEKFIIKRVIQATRGCYYHCKFCSVPVINPQFRMRPVDDVIQEVKYNKFKYWWQRKIVWFWDDNLLLNRTYAIELLQRLKDENKWWLTQTSIDIADDENFLDLMKKSGCIGVFLGIESFNQNDLNLNNKKHNNILKYKKAIEKIHNKGIAVMAGFIIGFEHDTLKSIQQIPQLMRKIKIDVPFISILTPFKGTVIYHEMNAKGKIIKALNWSNFNGYNVAFKHNSLNETTLTNAHRQLWKNSFNPFNVILRICFGMSHLRFGAQILSLMMNSFYGLKYITCNHPVNYQLISLKSNSN